ncbi:MAG TPA: hypothetical protein VHR39_18020 [Propionibacteriaceae bacterium]|nr:hypothetical protein [Propionibacteriaceae bacterium]
MNAASAGKIFRGTSAVVTVSLPSRGTPVLEAVTGLLLPPGARAIASTTHYAQL